jgi:hypothetical protein
MVSETGWTEHAYFPRACGSDYRTPSIADVLYWSGSRIGELIALACLPTSFLTT